MAQPSTASLPRALGQPRRQEASSCAFTFSSKGAWAAPCHWYRKERTSARSWQASTAAIGRWAQDRIICSEQSESVNTRGGGGAKRDTRVSATSSHWVELWGVRRRALWPRPELHCKAEAPPQAQMEPYVHRAGARQLWSQGSWVQEQLRSWLDQG